MSTEQAPSEGALSIDQAAGLLSEAPAPEEHEQEAAPEAEAVEEPQGEPEQVETVPEDEGEHGEEQPAEAPPTFWSSEDKAWFAEQDPADQKRILAYERHRDTATSQAVAKANEAQKAAETFAQKIQGLSHEAAQVLDQAKAAFVRPVPELGVSWDQIDWKAWIAQDPQTALAYKARYEIECDELTKLEQTTHATRQAADEQAFRAYVQGEYGKLQTLSPELAQDAAKRTAVQTYLLDQGIPAEALRNIGAQELVLAQKAMNWDKAQAALKAPKPPTRQTQPAGRSLRPGSAAPTTTPQRRSVREAEDRFASAKSVDAAAALLTARGSR